jgi:hypothetical protein
MWFNTRLNKAYSQAVQRGVEREYGFNELRDYYLIGDDSLLKASTEYEGLRRLEAYDLSGLASQASKQMLDDEQAELTRIMHRADGSVHGSLVRALCNGASSDTQGGAVRPGTQMAQSLMDQAHMWYRRGFDAGPLATTMDEAAKYWVHLRIRDERGRVVPVAIPDALLKGNTLDGGLGYVAPGVVAPRLVHQFSAKASGFRAALDKHVSAQWNLRNPSQAATKLWQRTRARGMEIDAGRVAAQLESGVFTSNRPDGLAMLETQADHNNLAAAIQQWEDQHTAGQPRFKAHTLNAAKMIRLVDAGWTEVAAAAREWDVNKMHYSKLRWDSPWSLTNILESNCLGTAAGAPGILSAVYKDGSRLRRSNAIKMMSDGHHAQVRLTKMVANMSDAFLDGRIKHPQSVGLIGSKHSVLTDLALTACILEMERLSDRGADTAMLPTTEQGAATMQMVQAILEHKILEDPYWGPQQGY